jgi:uncharacterized protein (DUF58 family)
MLGGAALVSALSVPAALLLQALIAAAAWLDARRAVVPSVRRTVSGSTALNGLALVEIRLTGADGPVKVTDDLGPGLERLRAGDGFGYVDGSSSEGALVSEDALPIRYALALGRRGNLTLGAVHLRALGPWGLAWRGARIDLHDRIRVFPGAEAIERRKLPGLRPEVSRVGPRRTRRWAEGSEFESLREYRSGDDPRTIDWKASARRPEILVRNYQVERNQTVVLAIDAGRLMREQIGDRERLDHALSSALALATRALAHGDRIGLIVFDEQVRTVIPAGRVRIAALADAFANVQARPVEPNYPIAFATLRRTFKKRSLVVIFSDVIDGAASSALVRSVEGAAARHLPLVVALRNPELEAVAAERGAVRGMGGSSPYRRAAAEELLDVRERALQGMRRAGVQVVDAAPGTISAALLSKYSEIKGRGLL